MPTQIAWLKYSLFKELPSNLVKSRANGNPIHIRLQCQSHLLILSSQFKDGVPKLEDQKIHLLIADFPGYLALELLIIRILSILNILIEMRCHKKGKIVYLQRSINLNDLLKKKSFFLLGPRATGKTSLITHQLPKNLLRIDLLRSDIFLRLNSKPWELEEIINAKEPPHKLVVIDEVQKLPILLNEVHRLIEEKKIKFLLTGSSARKLKKENVNLLAGRAWEAQLFPLTMQELPNFSLERYLTFGGLPSVYLSENPREELIAYVDTYLKEEIQAEALVRKVLSFSKFLTVAALTNGQMINFNALSNDVAIPASTVREYYQILEDTLVGFLLPAWTKTIKRKAMSTAKFYFFDVGVMHQLAGINTIEPYSDLYGRAFEHFIAMELRTYLSYKRKHLSLSYWGSTHGHEVDFIIGDAVAVEIKTTNVVSYKHLKGLKILKEENICKKYFLISFDKINKMSDGIACIYWEDFLNNLWQENYF